MKKGSINLRSCEGNLERRTKTRQTPQNTRKTFGIIPQIDENGPYFPFCPYFQHIGILTGNKYKRCEKKRCLHYIKLRFDPNVPFRTSRVKTVDPNHENTGYDKDGQIIDISEI